MVEKSVYTSHGAFGTCDVAYQDWGHTNAQKTVVCVHGLTRNSNDFDYLSKVLSKHSRVLCIDVPGRGESAWLEDPADYSYPTYCYVVMDLIAHLELEKVDWVGTSMGGIIGMMIAAMPRNPITKMVINDVGPFLPKEALGRINGYLSMEFEFASIDDIESHLRHIHQPFGPLTDEQWKHMATHSTRQDDAGRWQLAYDPRISEPFRGMVDEDIAFWEVWDAIQCPTLLLRGETSDILLRETAEEMLTRGPQTHLHEFQGIGHAPALMDEEQISIINNWLHD